ncbi:cysteine-rich KTR domain-containing protein, partial [Clostridioides difficile]
KIREDTVLINYPLYCPKCRQESLIVAKNMQISIVIEPNAHTYKAVNY